MVSSLPSERREVCWDKLINSLTSLKPPEREAFLWHMSRPVESVITLGPQASFSHEVAERVKKSGPPYSNTVILFRDSITEVCQGLVDGVAEQAVVPIENSTDGSVRDTLAAFRRHPVRIRSEVVHPISQSAYYLRGIDPRDIRYLASKDSALGQVRRNAALVFPNAELVERPSTVAAILEAAENPEMAAVGPRMVGAVYGLDERMIQIDNFHDNPLNSTRFKLIDVQDDQEIPATGDDKTSLIAQIPDRPGSLYRVLDLFVDQGVNLAKIKSFGRDGDYIAFLLDLEGYQEDLPLATSLRRLLKQGVNIKMLGSYPRDPYQPPQIPWELDMEYSIEKLKGEVTNGVNHREKTVVAFTLFDRVGALRDALNPFNRRGINLTEIDSLPTGKLGEYIFYLAFENGANQKLEALDELRKQCSRLVLI